MLLSTVQRLRGWAVGKAAADRDREIEVAKAEE